MYQKSFRLTTVTIIFVFNVRRSTTINIHTYANRYKSVDDGAGAPSSTDTLFKKYCTYLVFSPLSWECRT
jgi:hypothetical protein